MMFILYWILYIDLKTFHFQQICLVAKNIRYSIKLTYKIIFFISIIYVHKAIVLLQKETKVFYNESQTSWFRTDISFIIIYAWKYNVWNLYRIISKSKCIWCKRRKNAFGVLPNASNKIVSSENIIKYLSRFTTKEAGMFYFF